MSVFTAPVPQQSDVVEITLTEAINKLCDYRYARPVTLTLRTSCDPKMRKTHAETKELNPFYNNVEKVERINVFVNTSYAKLVQKRRMAEDPNQEDFVVRPAFGVKVDDAFDDNTKIAPMVQCGIGIDDKEDRVGLYLAVLPVNTCRDEDGEKDRRYEWTTGPRRGSELTDAEVEQMLTYYYDPTGEKRRASAAKNQGVKAEDVVGWLKPNMLSIEAFKMDGTTYFIKDHTLPEIPENVRLKALEDVTNARSRRDKKETLKKDCEKRHKALKKDDPRMYCLLVNRDYVFAQIEEGLCDPAHLELEIVKALVRNKHMEPGAPLSDEDRKIIQSGMTSKVVEKINVWQQQRQQS